MSSIILVFHVYYFNPDNKSVRNHPVLYVRNLNNFHRILNLSVSGSRSGTFPITSNEFMNVLYITDTYWSKFNILILTLTFLGGKPPKSKFRIDYEELTSSLIHIPKNFNRRNLHIWAKQLLSPRCTRKQSTFSQGRVSFLYRVNSKTIWWVYRPPERTVHF